MVVWKPEDIESYLAAIYVGVTENFQELVFGQAAVVAIWKLLVAFSDLHQSSNWMVDAVFIFEVRHGCFLRPAKLQLRVIEAGK